MNGLSHFHCIKDRLQFAISLIRGLGGNLTETSREEFAKQVNNFSWFERSESIDLNEMNIVNWEYCKYCENTWEYCEMRWYLVKNPS